MLISLMLNPTGNTMELIPGFAFTDSHLEEGCRRYVRLCPERGALGESGGDSGRPGTGKGTCLALATEGRSPPYGFDSQIPSASSPRAYESGSPMPERAKQPLDKPAISLISGRVIYLNIVQLIHPNIMKKIAHLFLALIALSFVTFAAQAQNTDPALNAALDKMQKVGIITAEDHAYWAKFAHTGKTSEVAKVRALLTAIVKYYGEPADTPEQIIDSLLKRSIVTNKSLVAPLSGTKKIAGSMLNKIIIRTGNTIPQ